MNTLPASVTAFFFCLLRVSMETDVFILLVLLAQWLFRNQLPPKWRYALWLLVVLRLALPWSLPTPVSAIGLIVTVHGLSASQIHNEPNHN
jgi:bla regulator protein BlaR1